MVAAMCGLVCLKCLLYILNTILTIMAIVIVAVGAGVLYLLNQLDEGASKDLTLDFTHLSTAGILIIIVGVLVVLFVFCGCCGAFLGTGWMLIWFAIIMGCLLIVECVILGFSWKYAERPELEKLLDKTFNALLDTAAKAQNANKDVGGHVQALLAAIQENFRCCGVSGPQDYWTRQLDSKLYCSSADGEYYTTGCTPRVADFFEKNGHTMGSVVVGTMVLQLVAICLAIFLYFTIA